MQPYDLGNPILIHSRLKQRYERHRRSMWVMKMLMALCFLGALGLAAWMAGGATAMRTDGLVELGVAVVVPVALVVVLAVLARASDR